MGECQSSILTMLSLLKLSRQLYVNPHLPEDETETVGKMM